MKTLTLALGAALCLSLLTTAPLAADSCNTRCADPCMDCCWDPCGWDGDFELGVHALYWKPIHCAIHFATRTVLGPPLENTVYDLKSDYDWGVRAFAGYQTDCTFVQVSYLYTNPTDNHKVDLAGANSLTVIGINLPLLAPAFFTRGQAQLNWEYQNVDIRLGQLLHRRGGCHFGVFGNFRWAYLERKLDIRGDEEEDMVPPDEFGGVTTVRSKFDGAGLGVGAKGEFCLWRGFNGFGELNVMGIIGDRRTPTTENTLTETDPNATPPTTVTTEVVNFRSHTCVIPALDFRLGVNYTYDCWCTTLVAEVGYEVNYYWNAIEAPLFTEASFLPDGNNRRCTDIGFGGLFFGLRALF